MMKLTLILFVLLAMLFALAQSPEINPTKTTETKVVGKQYGLIESTVDKITLIFAAKVERKQALLAKIAARRAEHVQFLIDNGKIEQATRYAEGTTKLNQSMTSTIQKLQDQSSKLTAKAGGQ